MERTINTAYAITRIRVLIHGWELPTFPKFELRIDTAHDIGEALYSRYPHARVQVDFDEEPEMLYTYTADSNELTREGRERIQSIEGPMMKSLIAGVLLRYRQADGMKREGLIGYDKFGRN
jgi:hypothetical protein